jgi:hypothetical protein
MSSLWLTVFSGGGISMESFQEIRFESYQSTKVILLFKLLDFLRISIKVFINILYYLVLVLFFIMLHQNCSTVTMHNFIFASKKC